ncbi:MAG TPA: bifunctional diguanylate cyclase/phosphodiesterase [Phenylobacterium sp.]|nr:bifunctional diguanylate cyclase/phosphodiesterase [Phenylobacterium sp.]
MTSALPEPAARDAEALLIEARLELRRVSESLAARIEELETERALTMHLARTDSLTGLLNRGAFTAALVGRLEEAERSGEPVALLVIDLDRFKNLNDSLGHDAGDQLLVEIGRRLKAAAREGDVVSRLGGDHRELVAEVLARWNHAERGMIPPGVFVPLAEELGLIAELDGAIFQSACQRASPWVSEGLIDTISCNVSQRELMDPAFSRKLIARLADTDLPATALTVEITETFLVHDLSLARRHIERLASRGVRIALDDFGTGYSNLRALLQLPIHTVKLDQSLIGGVGRDPRVSKLVRAMLSAAKSLDARIVAEGVEDEAQAIFLRAAGADRMQGYLFARPMPGDACEALMREQAAGAEAPTDRIMAAAATLRMAAF